MTGLHPNHEPTTEVVEMSELPPGYTGKADKYIEGSVTEPLSKENSIFGIMYNLYCLNYTVKCYDIFIGIKSPHVEFRNETRRNHRDHFQVHHLQVKYWKSGQNQNQMVPSMLKTQNAMTSWNHI